MRVVCLRGDFLLINSFLVIFSFGNAVFRGFVGFKVFRRGEVVIVFI